jgi:hypothetical protein
MKRRCPKGVGSGSGAQPTGDDLRLRLFCLTSCMVTMSVVVCAKCRLIEVATDMLDHLDRVLMPIQHSGPISTQQSGSLLFHDILNE